MVNTEERAEDRFKLVSPPDQNAELFFETVLADINKPQPKRPLQCVTIKMPLPAYLRMKRAAQRWNLTYTDVINFCTQRVVPVLESPSGQVAELLEQYRIEEEVRKALRPSKRKFDLPTTTSRVSAPRKRCADSSLLHRAGARRQAYLARGR